MMESQQDETERALSIVAENLRASPNKEKILAALIVHILVNTTRSPAESMETLAAVIKRIDEIAQSMGISDLVWRHACYT